MTTLYRDRPSPGTSHDDQRSESRAQAGVGAGGAIQLDLYGNPVKITSRHATKAKGYAAAPGSGPKGETCGTCGHHYVRKMSNLYHKCELTKGSGCRASDVLVKSPACWRWTPRPQKDGITNERPQAHPLAPERERRSPGDRVTGREVGEQMNREAR
ncbi:MAG: hypothetical protein WC829_02760 [Hyphomicrobium sp.]|jgi:hypothetical protein